ncbi:MAG TPA: ferrochelatase [Acidobacteriaceae bacterium]|jgi:ferrochelatase|nr:ferrochelatase [Acidobacteriaceae bacterium]
MSEAVLLLAHGTPDSVEEIPEYLLRVTGGRPLPEAAVEEVKHRFSAIGGSPLTHLTIEQGRLLQQEIGVPVYVGMRNWAPYIADVVHQMRSDGISRAVVVCLAPQNSRTSVGLYRRAVFAAAEGALALRFLDDWADHPLLADAFTERMRAVRDPWMVEAGASIPVLFTAHSVPCRTVISAPPVDSGSPGQSPPEPPDPYPLEAKLTASLVAARLGLAPSEWFFAFQSQGMSGGPWLGPTVEDTLTALRQQGVERLLLQPIGFLCDHVEILYDIDVAFSDFAAKLGIGLRRPASLNDSRLLTQALADLARHSLGRSG